MKLTRRPALFAISVFAGILAAPVAFAQGGNAPRAPVAHPATNPNCSLAPTPGVAFSTVVGTSWVFHWETSGGLNFDDPAAAVGNMSFIQVPDPNSQSGEAGFINVIETRNVEFECPSGSDITTNFVCPLSTAVNAESRRSGKAVSSNGRGLGTESVVNTNAGIFRFLNYVGRFQIFPDCTGGTLTFNTGVGPVNFDFYFRKLNGDPFGALHMVSTDANVETSFGEAEKQGPS